MAADGKSDESIRSSYKSAADFGDVLKGIVASKRPLRRIAEYGLLDGFSLDILARFSPSGCRVEGRDIFERFQGNRPRREALERRFALMPDVTILDGDFHDAERDLPEGAYDLLHVDIANDGTVYAEAVERLLPKLAPGGLLLLEGGTPERDQVPWMLERQRAPIVPELARLRAQGLIETWVLGHFPGLTVVRAAEAPREPDALV